MKYFAIGVAGLTFSLVNHTAASAQWLFLKPSEEFVMTQDQQFCVDDSAVLEQPLCPPRPDAAAAPSVRGSHSLKVEAGTKTKADIILLSAKASKLQDKIFRTPNTANNWHRRERMKQELVAMQYELTMLTAGLSN